MATPGIDPATGMAPTEAGKFYGGPAMVQQIPSFGVPPPMYGNQIQGTGGYVSKGAQFLSGLQLGSNLMGNLQEAKRGKADYDEKQAVKNAHGNSLAGSTGQAIPSEHPLLASLGSGLAHLGTGLAGYFGGGGGGVPSPNTPPQGAMPQAQMPDANAAPPTAMNPATTAAGLTPYEGGGTVTPNNPMVSPAALAAAPAPGYDMDPNSPGNTGAAVPAGDPSAGIRQPPAPQDAPPPPFVQNAGPPDLAHPHAIEAAMEHLVAGTLPESHPAPGTTVTDGKVNDVKKAALPAPGPQGIQQIANTPDAAAGIPEGTPPHSLTPAYWQKSDDLINKAAVAAARAGYDPNQTFGALTAVRTSYIQGHLLRNAASANAAWLNGDQKALVQSLKDINYYLPNGQDLEVKPDPKTGMIAYQSPIDPYVDANGVPTQQPTSRGPDGKLVQNQKNIIPVDGEHIKMLVQNIMDPMKVQDAIMSVRGAHASIALEAQKGQAAVEAAHGVFLRGQGLDKIGDATSRKVAGENYLHLAEGDQAAARGRWYDSLVSGGGRNQDPALLAAGKQIDTLADQEQRGAPTTVPLQVQATDSKGKPQVDAQGKPVMTDNLSPLAGKNSNDPNKVPSFYKNASPEAISYMKGRAFRLMAANRQDNMGPQEALELSRSISEQQGKTHKEGNVVKKNVVASKDGQFGHVWVPNPKEPNGGHYRPFRTSPDISRGMSAGQNEVDPGDLGAPGGSGIPPGQPSAADAAVTAETNPNADQAEESPT